MVVETIYASGVLDEIEGGENLKKTLSITRATLLKFGQLGKENREFAIKTYDRPGLLILGPSLQGL